jgi:undecaprenyl diphosphate synthase
MKQRSLLPAPGAIHVGIIMDGNGRWATGRGHPRAIGHAEGARTVVRIVEAAPALGIGMLTLYAFSSDNWRRPPREVASLMRLFRKYLHAETARCVETGVRLTIIGRRDRLGAALRRAIEVAEATTAGGRVLDLRIAIDYSGRDAIVRAAAAAGGTADELTPERFAELLAGAYGGEAPVRDVDLLIRTGGEQRVSDFMLWESAYAELYFTPRMWPEFGAADLGHAVREFHGRDRRFGGLSEAVAG